jgi:hypothetical protein
VVLSDEEFALLLGPLTDGRGMLRVAALTEALCGDSYSAARQDAVHAAYRHLAAAAPVTVGRLKAAFDAKFDPRVVAGAMTPAEAAAEFVRQWPLHRAPADAVTPEQFEAYYESVAACVADDWAFVDMVANVWHVPGSGSWKGKRGKRVLVTFHKGSSTETVIPGGEDIDDADFEGLAAALKHQGFGGIARIKVLGLAEDEE